MKRTYYFLFTVLAVFILSACSSGHTAYKRGDYFKACFEAIDHLKTSPNSEKSQFVLSKAYPLALKTATREIENANIANAPDKYDVLVYQYERISTLAGAIYACPKANQIISAPVEYTRELSDAKKMAAESAYQRGIQALNVGTVEQARVAYKYFLNANKYYYGYSDVLNKIEDAKYYATYRILVQKPLTSYKYQYSADFFYNNLLSDLVKITSNKFIRFYTPEEAARENMNDPHQYLILDFQGFSVGNVRDSHSSLDVKRDSVVVGTVKVEGKTYNSYATVKATLITYVREIVSGGILNVRIIDVNSGRNIQERNFSGQFVWKDSWSTYRGDDRALSSQQKSMCDKKPIIPPSQQDLFVEFTKPIYDQTLPYLKGFYSKY